MHLLRAWNRRDFLKAAGIGAAAAVLPFVPEPARAQVTGPKRLLLLTHGNGSVLQRWRDNGSARFSNGAALPELAGPILAPLAPFRDRLLLVDGIDLMSIFSENGEGTGWGVSYGHDA